MDWLDYRKKLGIGFGDQEKFVFFKKKIFNFLLASDCFTTKNEYVEFCDCVGVKCDECLLDDDLEADRYEKCLCAIENHSNNIEEFLWYYLAFVNARKESRKPHWTKEMLLRLLQDKLDESHIPYEILKDEETVFVFPKGAEELDNALVSEPLKWLEGYPSAHAAFTKALKVYADATDETASDVADQFRKSLEAFFQEFFASGKTLENLNRGKPDEKIEKSEYAKYLTAQGVPGELANDFASNLQSYTNYMNNYAKHHDKTSKKVLEYLMYQTGNIIRLLITLRQEETPCR